jgi:hypothetical protein
VASSGFLNGMVHHVTQDVDMMANQAARNAHRTLSALGELGADVDGLKIGDVAANTQWDTPSGPIDILLTALGPNDVSEHLNKHVWPVRHGSLSQRRSVGDLTLTKVTEQYLWGIQALLSSLVIMMDFDSPIEQLAASTDLSASLSVFQVPGNVAALDAPYFASFAAYPLQGSPASFRTRIGFDFTSHSIGESVGLPDFASATLTGVFDREIERGRSKDFAFGTAHVFASVGTPWVLRPETTQFVEGGGGQTFTSRDDVLHYRSDAFLAEHAFPKKNEEFVRELRHRIKEVRRSVADDPERYVPWLKSLNKADRLFRKVGAQLGLDPSVGGQIGRLGEGGEMAAIWMRAERSWENRYRNRYMGAFVREGALGAYRVWSATNGLGNAVDQFRIWNGNLLLNSPELNERQKARVRRKISDIQYQGFHNMGNPGQGWGLDQPAVF